VSIRIRIDHAGDAPESARVTKAALFLAGYEVGEFFVARGLAAAVVGERQRGQQFVDFLLGTLHRGEAAGVPSVIGEDDTPRHERNDRCTQARLVGLHGATPQSPLLDVSAVEFPVSLRVINTLAEAFLLLSFIHLLVGCA
jgi:hypothetical protein